MSKPLAEMTLEELWQLFPIYLTEHQSYWKDWYEEEYKRIEPFFSEDVRINHIGSTAIDNIWAKPIIDILVEIPRETDILTFQERIEQLGYRCMSSADNRISFNKGYTENGFATKVFHLHLRYFGDHDELYFRDYLNEFPEVAEKYQQMKLELWKEFEHNRDGYTNAKTDFIKKYTTEAKERYKK